MCVLIFSDSLWSLRRWVAPTDGLLVRDLNNNRTIDNISELIGTTTTDAYSVLRTLESNKDGKITAADTVWKKLKVWHENSMEHIPCSDRIVCMEIAA